MEVMVFKSGLPAKKISTGYFRMECPSIFGSISRILNLERNPLYLNSLHFILPTMEDYNAILLTTKSTTEPSDQNTIHLK